MTEQTDERLNEPLPVDDAADKRPDWSLPVDETADSRPDPSLPVEETGDEHPDRSLPADQVFDASPAPAPLPSDESLGLAVALEVFVYAALALIALVLRLFRPDWMPLDPSEAAIAVPAWMSTHGTHVSLVTGSPLLQQVERLSFWLLGGGESVARFAPAMCGAAAVLFMYKLRGAMGHAGALAAALLLALSPLWVFYGRNVSPTALAMLAIVVLLGSAISRFPRDANVLPVAAALALAAGGLSYTFLLAAAAFAVVRYASGGRAALDDDIGQLWPTPVSRNTAAIVFVVTVILAATGMLTQTAGLAALVQHPAEWLTQLFDAPFSGSFGFGLSLLAYAPVILVFGVPGTVLAARRGTAAGRFLALWVMVGAVVGLVGGAPLAVGSVLLPLTLAAGLALGHLLEATADVFRWQEDGAMVGIVLIVLSYAGVQLLTFSYQADAQMGSSSWMLAMGALALALLLIIAYSVLWGRVVALRVAAWALVIGLGALALSNGSNLNYRTATVLREPMRTDYTSPGAQTLADNLAQVSWQTTRDPNLLQTTTDPLLRPNLEWPLRDRAVTWSPIEGIVTAPSIVVPAGVEVATGDAAYRGQTHVAGGRWEVGFADRHDFVRWLFHRKPSDVSSGVDMNLADLYVGVSEPQEGDG